MKVSKNLYRVVHTNTNLYIFLKIRLFLLLCAFASLDRVSIFISIPFLLSSIIKIGFKYLNSCIICYSNNTLKTLCIKIDCNAWLIFSATSLPQPPIPTLSHTTSSHVLHISIKWKVFLQSFIFVFHCFVFCVCFFVLSCFCCATSFLRVMWDCNKCFVYLCKLSFSTMAVHEQFPTVLFRTHSNMKRKETEKIKRSQEGKKEFILLFGGIFVRVHHHCHPQQQHQHSEPPTTLLSKDYKKRLK